ncbi:MAG TPA: DNA-formamidopyrimidine glycosylase family protein [Acidimicrobiia bacterium]|nr:DNA-formamidopyrimidine glycosylase family protein [Acidimicrobiia bacterium]
MPELPQMQALAERLDAAFVGSVLTGYEPLSFSSLNTVVPSPDELVGNALESVGRRGKYLVFGFTGGLRLLVHLSQAGRLHLEPTPKSTRPRGAVLRLTFEEEAGSSGPAMLVREYGKERKAAWWVLAAGDDGPLDRLGPEPGSEEFARLVLEGDDSRRINTWLRDQRTVAGIGRGYTDDILWRARLSPYATLRQLDADRRASLLTAVGAVLDEGLALERRRTGGLQEPKLGEHFEVHGRAGEPCPRCGTALLRVSYESYEVVYCAPCQTGSKVLADRRMSKLLK